MTTQKNIRYLLLVVIAASSISLMIGLEAAYAHMSFTMVPGSGSFKGSGGYISSGTGVAPTNGNHTVTVVIGETDEPAYTGGIHDLEIRMTHTQTSFGVGNAHKDQTKTAYQQSDFSATGKVLKVDAYFFPASALTVQSTGAKALFGGVYFSNATNNPGSNTAGFWCDDPGTANNNNVMKGNAFNCVPNSGGSFGYTDSRTGMFARPLAAHEVPIGFNLDGTYRQSTRQHYTQQGLTLYHVYGSINYFNDTSVGLTNINLWTDGKNIKTLSLSQGTNYTNNAKQTYTGSVANRTATISGGFGLGNFTSSPDNGYSQGLAWPDNSGGTNEQMYPTDIRTAIGQIRDNTWDIWNVLEQIANGLNAMTDFTPKAPDHTPRNYTNPGPTSSGQYTFP